MAFGTARGARVGAVGRKNEADPEVENRIRAHIRQGMERRGFGVTETARRIGMSQGNLTKTLQGTRGISAGTVARVVDVFKVDAMKLLFDDPPQKFFEVYVPRPDSAAEEGL